MLDKFEKLLCREFDKSFRKLCKPASKKSLKKIVKVFYDRESTITQQVYFYIQKHLDKNLYDPQL